MYTYSMYTYDAIVVLGSRPNPQTWEFPSHVYESLDKAIKYIEQGAAPYLVLSGNHAIDFDDTDIIQPFKESDKMEVYALSKGIPAYKILKEGISLTTSANFYYLKKLVFKPRNIHNLLLITADYRVSRIEFLWRKIMGANYSLTIDAVSYDDKYLLAREQGILARQKDQLKKVVDGDDIWFTNKFNADPRYDKAPR